MTDLGHLTPARADAIRGAFAASEARADTRMITPGVLEIIAVRR
jgi:hypothetical protein